MFCGTTKCDEGKWRKPLRGTWPADLHQPVSKEKSGRSRVERREARVHLRGNIGGGGHRRSERSERCPSSLPSASEAPSVANGRFPPSRERNSSTSHVILMRQSPFVQMQCARACVYIMGFLSSTSKTFSSRVQRPAIQHDHARF